MNIHFSSKTEEWATPHEFFLKVQEEFNLNLDVCATKENAKLDFFWTKKDNGLTQDWFGMRCWMNPPYGRVIGEWVKKASEGGASYLSLMEE